VNFDKALPPRAVPGLARTVPGYSIRYPKRSWNIVTLLHVGTTACPALQRPQTPSGLRRRRGALTRLYRTNRANPITPIATMPIVSGSKVSTIAEPMP
jgi:hypothetical protein